MQNVLVGLDIGSSSVKAILAELGRDGRTQIVRVLKFPSEGIRKGMVDDMATATRTLGAVFSEINNIPKTR